MSEQLNIDDAPLVSLVLATYNSEMYLEECLISILGQSYNNFEILIIDGGSRDNSVSIIKKYSDKIRYWISEPDRGVYDAWNKALHEAKGDWIAFIGSDDILYPDALDTYINHILNHPRKQDLEFVSSKLDLVDNDLTFIETVGEEWDWKLFKKSMVTWHVGCFHSKKLFIKYGYFNPNYKISGDYEFLLRPKNHLMASYVDKRTVKMRNGGISSTKLIQASEETYKAKINNGVISFWKGYLLLIIDKLRLNFRAYFWE
ncbi:glycosyltransferase family 2 protein [Spirosoma humi]